MTKRPESVLVVIYTAQGRALMLRRLDDANFWQSVTGSLETGETPYQTAVREVMEETGIDIDGQGLTLNDLNQQVSYEIRPLWRKRYAEGVTTNIEHQFTLALPAKCEISLTEHSEYCWLPLKEAAERASSASNRQVILALTK
ncbi:dihydroneopterin triphosphate diphosphatase [Motilimonas sp. 1_MG-2023]|uniref:dihydroneopterin triphosphate diphosphatase n=1 Tax=Motilimonas sp. 1_MG-2023 TaxID=3062672 RepID=UPI0026E23805|nr:dihydroneopterin triphosphate diphosphatase [Motilimonas sp. 1_MG-2023]MDO6527592.1 dihydroneopterin triphosphate diphosphatase [Motilimonas sp. 1_MG-2023]